MMALQFNKYTTQNKLLEFLEAEVDEKTGQLNSMPHAYRLHHNTKSAFLASSIKSRC